MDERWKNLEPPKPLAPISVNINDWEKRTKVEIASLDDPVVISTTPELDNKRECIECGLVKGHAVNDYICWECREKNG